MRSNSLDQVTEFLTRPALGPQFTVDSLIVILLADHSPIYDPSM